MIRKFLFTNDHGLMTTVGLVAWCSGNAFDPISEVTVRRTRLILRGVTVCGQVNHFSM